MLKEFLESLTTTIRKSEGARVVASPEPEGRYWMQHPDGALTEHQVGAGDRGHEVLSLESLVEFAKRRCDMSASSDYPSGLSIWHSRDGVTLLLDDVLRRDTVSLSLAKSTSFDEIEELGAGKSFTQKDILRFLRVTLANCLSACPSLVDQLKKVNWSKSDTGSSTITQGKASLGRAIESNLTGVATIPDEVKFYTPIWDGYNFISNIVCDLEADAERSVFVLTPKAGEIEGAVRDAEQKLAVELTSILSSMDLIDKVPLYYGTP